MPADRLLFEVDEPDALCDPGRCARFATAVGALGSGIIIDGLGRGGDFVQPVRRAELLGRSAHGHCVSGAGRGATATNDRSRRFARDPCQR